MLRSKAPILETSLHSEAAALSSVLLKTNWCNQSAITRHHISQPPLMRRGRRAAVKQIWIRDRLSFRQSAI